MPSSPDDVTFDAASGRLHEGGPEERVYLPWPALTAFVSDAAGMRPRAFRPTVDLREWRAHAVRNQFLERIPDGVIDVVAEFPARHWELLVFVAQCGPGALDLLTANPALGYMVGNIKEFLRLHRTEPMVAARLLLMERRSQRDIAARLGFPGTEAVRSILRKIEHRALAMPLLRALRRHIADTACQQRLVHLPRITTTVLTLAGKGTLPLLSPRLLEQIAEGALTHAASVPRLLADTDRMWRQLHDGQSPAPFASVRRLREEHDRLVTIINASPTNGTRHDVYKAPLEGNESIVPLDRAALLAEEGQLQRNCVASYTSRVLRGELFVYRVLAPTRATLSIVRRGSRWRIHCLEAAGNRRVPPGTRAAVAAWLKTTQPPTCVRLTRQRRQPPA